MRKNIRFYALLFLLLTFSFSLAGCEGRGNATTEVPALEEAGHEHEEHGQEGNHEESHQPGAAHEHGQDHQDSGGDAEEAGHEHEELVRMTGQEAKQFGIETAEAGPGKVEEFVSLPGVVMVNADRTAHIVPRVSGIVRAVYKKLGDRVRAGELLAEIDSQRLVELKVAYLSAKERYQLANELFAREKKLWEKKITAEQEYLASRQAAAEARISLRSAEQKLHALGLSEEDLKALADHQGGEFSRYAVTAPFDGTVIEKHITVGESVKDDSSIFVIADLSTVWVDIRIYQKDLPHIRANQEVLVLASHGGQQAKGILSYISPMVDEKTRTAPGRIVLDNRNGAWRPGMFITARIAVDAYELPLVVPRSALQNFEGRQVVFVRTPEGFKPQPVQLGRANDELVEVVAGLVPGQEYVRKGAFTLKAQLSKETFGDGHSH